MEKLKVRSRINPATGKPALVPHHHMLAGIEAGTVKLPSFVGVVFKADKGRHSFEMTKEVVEIENSHENRHHVKVGDLWAADQETADVCGVQFDPAFGSEAAVAVEPADEQEGV